MSTNNSLSITSATTNYFNIFNYIIFYINYHFIVKYINPYIRIIPFGKGVKSYMTSYELIWRLIIVLLFSNYNNESQDKNKD